MKKIIFFSSESFIDVDIPLLPGLNKKVNLHYMLYYSDLARSEQHVYYPEKMKEFCREHNISSEIITYNTRARNPRRLLKAISVLSAIRRSGADAVYIEGVPDPWFVIVASVLLSKRNTIIARHDAQLHPGTTHMLHRFIQRIETLFFKNFQLFSVSQTKLFSSQYPGKKLFTIDLCPKDFGSANVNRRLDNPMTFLFFGRDYEYKGLDILIDAVNRIPSKFNNFRVIVAGRSPDFKRFDAVIQNRQFYDLRLNYVNSVDIASLFAETDYVILPYRQVTQSGPLFIAFHYHVPVIVSDLDGFREYYSDETGMLFKPGDSADLALALVKALEGGKDQVNKYSNGMKDYVSKRFNINDHLEKYMTMFEAVS